MTYFTRRLTLIQQALPASALALHVPKVRSFALTADKLFREALLKRCCPARIDSPETILRDFQDTANVW